MLNLKTFCLSFLFSGLFLSCSSAQDKPLPTPLPSPTISLSLEASRFESTEGGFAINIFEVPFQIQDFATETAKEKGVDVGKFFVWKSGNMVFTAMYANPFDFDGNSIIHTLEEFNIGVRKAVARKQGKMISEKSISFGKYSGTEFRYISVDGVKFINRNYLINSKGYQITAGYSDKDEKKALEVLDSFELLPDKLK